MKTTTERMVSMGGGSAIAAALLAALNFTLSACNCAPEGQFPRQGLPCCPGLEAAVYGSAIGTCQRCIAPGLSCTPGAYCCNADANGTPVANRRVCRANNGDANGPTTCQTECRQPGESCAARSMCCGPTMAGQISICDNDGAGGLACRGCKPGGAACTTPSECCSGAGSCSAILGVSGTCALKCGAPGEEQVAGTISCCANMGLERGGNGRCCISAALPSGNNPADCCGGVSNPATGLCCTANGRASNNPMNCCTPNARIVNGSCAPCVPVGGMTGNQANCCDPTNNLVNGVCTPCVAPGMAAPVAARCCVSGSILAGGLCMSPPCPTASQWVANAAQCCPGTTFVASYDGQPPLQNGRCIPLCSRPQDGMGDSPVGQPCQDGTIPAVCGMQRLSGATTCPDNMAIPPICTPVVGTTVCPPAGTPGAPANCNAGMCAGDNQCPANFRCNGVSCVALPASEGCSMTACWDPRVDRGRCFCSAPFTIGARTGHWRCTPTGAPGAPTCDPTNGSNCFPVDP